MSMRKAFITLTMLMLAMPAMAQDRDGQDVPSLPRYAASVIERYGAPSLNDIVVPTGPIAKEDSNTNRQKLEGRVTQIDYRLEPPTATLQIDRYYRSILQQSGFKEIFSCSGDACGGDMASLILNSGKVAPVGFATSPFNETMRVIVAKKDDTWVLLHMATDRTSSMVYEAVIENARP
jgi:hypothetical protein